VIQRDVQNPLASLILEGKVGATVTLDVKNNELVIEV
jgi:ATP-dependent Clp protease ATP-binding subunit ClpA